MFAAFEMPPASLVAGDSTCAQVRASSFHTACRLDRSACQTFAAPQKRGWINQLPKYLPWLKRSSPYYNLISDESQIWQGEAAEAAAPDRHSQESQQDGQPAAYPALSPTPLMLLASWGAILPVLDPHGWPAHISRRVLPSMPQSSTWPGPGTRLCPTL